MIKTKKQELIIFLIISGIAAFFRLYQANTSTTYLAMIGILTVIGLYLLTKELFEWRLAAIASYLMAISFWHVNFSRSGTMAIIIPFLLVYAFYFLWKGIKNGHLSYFFIAGIFVGLGFYTYSFYMAPIIAIILFLNYWWYLKKDFSHEKYEHAKTKLLRGFVVFALTSFAIALPIAIYFWQNGVFLQARPAGQILPAIIKTLVMFNFTASPLLPWPIGVFFVIGFINEIIHWLRRKHGHFSTAHTLMFAWFFVALIPGFLSNAAPDALLTIGALPAVMTFTARGIWWFFDKLRSWYSLRNPTEFLGGLKHRQDTTPRPSIHEAHAITALVMIIFLFSIGFMEYWRYFK